MLRATKRERERKHARERERERERMRERDRDRDRERDADKGGPHERGTTQDKSRGFHLKQDEYKNKRKAICVLCTR